MAENNNTYQFIQKLAEREGVAEEKIKEIIINSIRKTYYKKESDKVDLHIEFDKTLLVYRKYKVVPEVRDSEREIAVDSNLLKEGKTKDNIFFLPLDIRSFSLSLNYEIKKQLQKDLGIIQEEKQYNFFKPFEGQLVRGSIQNVQENYYLVNLGKGIGHWDKSEWTLSEKPRLGQNLYFLVKEVREKTEKSAPQVILTRYDDLFLTRLLELEIPEIKEGTIAIRHILRLPGLVSKVIIESKKWGIEPLGTCIGKGAERIKTLSRLVYPERIDLATWTENKKQLLFNLLSPVKTLKLTIKKTGEWEIIVSQQKASLLLQHEGKILKKISEYLEVNIHAVITEEIEKNEVLANKGQIFQEVGSYKNIEVQIVEEIEK